ncbi:MAG: MMPL family transporter [Boseongicola sp. SB0662_bin_57]|nr:MMPL family transporter [Boseongicola sp. SB0662_bin_57]
MARFKARVERWFEASATCLCRRRVPAIIVVLLATAAAATGLRNLVVDTSTESFLRTGDPVLERYEEFRNQFGRDDVIIVSVEPEELFTHGSLTELKKLHDALASGVPYLAHITSMVNARSTRGEGDLLIVEDLLQSWPDSEQDLAALRFRVLANPLYRNLLISPDGTVTTIALELARFAGIEEQSVDDALALFDESPPDAGPRERLGDEETQRAFEAVDKIVAEHGRDGFILHVAGTPAVMESLKSALQEDMARSVLLAIAVIAILLFAMFRSVAAVVLPLGVVLLALLSTLGLMGHLATPVTLPIVILPSFLLAVGVGAAVHLLAIHFRNIRAGLDRERAIVAAVGHAGLPVLLTSLTTAAGLGSFAVADVAPIADLGRYSAIGILIALVYTLVLLPAGLALIPSRAMQAVASPHRASALTDRVLAAFARFGVRNAVPIVCAFLVVATVAFGFAVQLRFSHDVLSWLPDDWPVHQATRAIDRDLGGSVSLEVVLDTGTENGLHDRDTLLRLDALKRGIETESRGPAKVGAVLSVADLLKEIHQALNENRAEFHRIPENPALIPQEFLLFENSGSDDLEDLVDFGFSRARFSMRVPWQDTLHYPPFIRDVEERFASAFGSAADVTVTGIMSLLSRTLENTIHSAARSYLIAGVVITLMMIALIGRVGTGLISMLPNFTPILLTLALMQVAGIPLNLFTMLVGSIALGLAVDDTVHFMHHFHRYLERTGSVERAVHETLQTSGRAMLLTSAVLTAGFFIFCLADMRNLVDFGLLTGITIVTALAADFVLAPALMALRYRSLKRPEAIAQLGEAE